MRSVLFTIPLDGRVDLGPLGKVPVFGFGLVLALWALFGLASAALHLRREGLKSLGTSTIVVWIVIALAIIKGPELLPAVPIYGYGTMLFLGFLASMMLAAWRLRREGADGEIAWDVAMWIFISGILGARMYYVATHADRFFGVDPETEQVRSLPQILKALVNLPDGGLVLYGGLILAPLAYWLFCRRRHVHALALADVVISSVFVGVVFGRLGCFLHGCCFGDVCTLPWGVEFPNESLPFKALVARGLIGEGQAHSLSLHPTQLYDSLNALLLVILTYVCYPFRRRSGEVLAIGWMAYPINRFLIEFLRSDEPPVWGTPFTGAQLVSLGLFAAAVAFTMWLETKPAGLQPLMVPAEGGAQRVVFPPARVAATSTARS